MKQLDIPDALFRVIDTETTGLEVETARIVEIGACDVYSKENADGVPEWVQSPAEAWLCNPGIPIPPEAKAVHHIVDADVATMPPAIVRISGLQPAAPLSQSHLVYVAHNAKYDRPILEAHGMVVGARWLCTHRLAMHCWPDAPKYGNEVLRYWLGHDRVPWLTATHRAAHDAAVTALILREALKHCYGAMFPTDVDALIAWAEEPVVLKGKLGFGKHFDLTWAEVAQRDSGYLDWMIKQEQREPGSWEPDKIHTARHYRGQLV